MEKGWFVVVKHLDRWLLDVYAVPYENDIHQFYKELDCSVFDIVQAETYTPYITKDPYDVVICDDNGKLINKYPTFPVYHPIDHDLVDILVGDVGFLRRCENDLSELRGYTKEEVDDIINSIKHYVRTFSKFKIKE